MLNVVAVTAAGIGALSTSRFVQHLAQLANMERDLQEYRLFIEPKFAVSAVRVIPRRFSRFGISPGG